MDSLKRLLLGGEDQLVRRVMALARENAYAQVSPALEDDYRAVVSSLTANLVQSLALAGDVPEVRATDDLAVDAVAALGDRMARADRGGAAGPQIEFGMLKRYRQAYVGLVGQSGASAEKVWRYTGVLDRFFDRVELGYIGRLSADPAGTIPKAIIDRSRDLTAERDRYVAAFADLPIPILLLDQDGRVENANAAASLLLDPAGTLRHRRPKNPARREPPPVLAEEIDAFRAGPESEMSFECELRTGRGTRFFQVRFARMHGPNGTPGGMLVSLTDLTYRRHAEEALRRSQAKYASLFENMLAAVAYIEVVLDRRNRPVDYTVLEVNPAFETLAGAPFNQLVGRRLTEVLPGIEEEGGPWMGALGRTALTGETSSFDARATTSGRWFAVALSRSASGHLTIMLSDISELKFIQESLERERASRKPVAE